MPTYIRVANDQQMLEMALIENIHREDLNSLDIAISYQRLIDECKMTNEELSERIGKDRSTITNYVRLLKLPPQVQLALRDNKISMGHARAFINIEDVELQLEILRAIISKNLSVRDVERIVKELNGRSRLPAKIPATTLPDKYLSAKQGLSSHFGARVEIRQNNKGKGSIVIPFKSEKEFDRILALLEK